MKKIAVPLIMVFSLTGCSGEKEEVHDVGYYYQNFEECKKQVEKCQNNPGKLEDTPNCKNAKAAYHKRLIYGDGTIRTPTIRTD